MNIHKIRGVVVALLAVAVPVIGLMTNTQLGALCSYGASSIATICPLGALETLAAVKSPSIRLLICLCIAIVLIVVVGKAVCAWACPAPWLQRFFKKKKHVDENALQAKPEESTWDIHPAKGESCSSCPSQSCGSEDCALAKVGGKRDGIHLDSRHAVLAATLASSAVFGFPVFCLVCPVGLTFATIIGLWNLFAFNETTLGMIIFPLILIAELVLLRKWCHKICPISALMSLISCANRTFKPRVDESRCLRAKGVDCRACVESCPEELDPHSKLIPECSKCHACAEACPAHAISFTKHRLTSRKSAKEE